MRRPDDLARLRRMTTPPQRSIVELIADGVLDAELAATAWLLLEARVPLLVAGAARRAGKSTLLEALLAFLPLGVRRVDVEGELDDLAWLPEVDRLGGPFPPVAGQPARAPAGPVTPASAYLVAAELSDHLPIYTWGTRARTLIRAATIGYGVAATIHADRLEEVHASLKAPPVGLTDDELSHLGLVLVVRRTEARRRVAAAHYARPVVRDGHGHVQRMPPAVLAARDERTGLLEHFGWGIAPELAGRTGRRAGDYEAEAASRAAYLAGLVEAGIVEVDAVRTALAGYRGTTGASAHRPV